MSKIKKMLDVDMENIVYDKMRSSDKNRYLVSKIWYKDNENKKAPYI